MAKEKRIKEPIKLRQKKIADGNVSLYLDIYRNGKRTYEFLKLYLIPERTKDDKEKNRQTLQLANAVKAQRIVELQNGEFGFKAEFATDTLFFDYYRAMCQKRLGAESRSNWGNWFSCLHHLKRYEKNERITFAKITSASGTRKSRWREIPSCRTSTSCGLASTKPSRIGLSPSTPAVGSRTSRQRKERGCT